MKGFFDAAEQHVSAVLRLNGVSRRYPGAGEYALSDLSLTVPPGEVLALVGESGSGKTTALRLIAGFDRPDEGTVELSGQRVAGPEVFSPPEERGVGMVFQDQALFPHLTVGENVAFGLRTLPGSELRARVQQVLELTGVAGLESRYPHELSGGQMQRVAVARSLAPRPSVVLLDEPFNNLDAPLKRRLRRELREVLRASGTAAVLVTHDADEAFALASRIVFLDRGRSVQQGTPQELFETPARADVATFFGPVNVIPAEPADTGYETAFGPVEDVRPSPSLKTIGPGGAGNTRGRELLVRPDAFVISEGIPDCRNAGGGALLIRGRVAEVTFRGAFFELLVSPERVTEGIDAPSLLEVHVSRRTESEHVRWQPGDHICLALRRRPVCAACPAVGHEQVHEHT